VLVDMLICPSCLPRERGLHCRAEETAGEEIQSGSLTCPKCDTPYAIVGGIADLVPETARQSSSSASRYESAPLLADYLWSHYADLFGDADANTAYRDWAGLIGKTAGYCLDAGCSVGRFSLEMASKCDFVVGLDRSFSFVQTARDLLVGREVTFSVPVEGMIHDIRSVHLPEAWQTEKIEFIVGDAQALPFPSGLFSTLSSLNLVDKVPMPLRHLREMNRAAKKKGAQFLFSDPFSWSEEIADRRNWLGGIHRGPFAGRGLDNVTALFRGEKGGMEPPWTIEKQGSLWWKIRNHQNHFELIRSCFVKASR
jgi:SAM-dependent methyltransferase